MKISEIIEKRPVSCAIDTTYKTDRQTGITMYQDANLTIGNQGTIHKGTPGMTILIECRHNGSDEDKVEAFNDAMQLIANTIFE
jgi:hypothetical protein